MIDRTHDLPVTRQCQILKLARSPAHYTPQPVTLHRGAPLISVELLAKQMGPAL